MTPVTYRDAGVDIEEGARFVESIYELMQRTFSERVVENRGGFGALFSLDYDERLFRHNYRHPVLVSSTDGVGTKLKVAFMTGRHETVGIDLVAMCVNDILVLGAEPLFFLDYLAMAKLEPAVHQQVVAGIAAGCREAGCSLLGGETAEMPGFYKKGEYDMAGFAVGVVEARRLINGAKIEPGHVVVGLPSSGLHSNGYSLVRRLFFEQEGMRCTDSLARFGIERTLAEELLTPTRIYVRAVRAVLRHYRVKQVVGGIVHVTGGGLLENTPRVLPGDCAVELDSSSWRRPPIFDAVRRLGEVPEEEMYRTFNMGLGMLLMVAPYYADSVLRQLRKAGEEPVVVGRVVPGQREVKIR
ncbi:MAG: phosphoribosylaminoimidazole synthetase [Planctomycetes bacterium SM23_32]|nr:MAG: phosphoribosylaminoimidazole synthetase [Planctomycetes bacterium SM23_32]